MVSIFSGKGSSYRFCNHVVPDFCAKLLFENLIYCLAGFGWWVSIYFCVLNRRGSGSVGLQEINN